MRNIYGHGFIEDTPLLPFKFRISPNSFYQVNHDQAERAVQKRPNMRILRAKTL